MNLAFTICSANYLPYAKAVGDSLIKHNPGYQFIIALADEYQVSNTSFFEPHQVVPVQQMNIPGLAEMNNRYNIFELSCALKPFVSRYLLTLHPHCQALFYFDSDIILFSSLQKAENILQTNFLLLTPHLASPLPYEAAVATELDILRTGIYNAGFFGLKNTEEGFVFLDWWEQRLRHHCFNDAAHGLFVDQLWLSLAPVFFRNCFVLYDPGYNLAYWNFLERRLSIWDGQYLVNEKHPLVFYHYSGYDIQQPEKISRHQREGLTLTTLPEYKSLFDAYRTAINANNTENFFSLPTTMGKPIEIPAVREKNFFKRKYKKLFKK
ncbi:MAG TPA: hypothetical protein VF609_13090 [Flavisolibacter sp.]|jgi:hypothetical protein